MSVLARVRAPASTANLGPGFDCAAVALDLWNELEVSEGDGEVDLDHLGVRAFARIAPVESRRFRFVDRIPRERGLGASAAVIALGLVAASLVAGRHADYEELFEEGFELEGHGDNLAAALVGGVCLTWDRRIVRVADRPPAVPIALVPEATVSTAAAREALPTQVPACGRGVHHLPCGTPRRFARVRIRGALLGGARRPPARALSVSDSAVARGRARGVAGGSARREHLRLRPDRHRLGACARPPKVARRSFPAVTPASA